MKTKILKTLSLLLVLILAFGVLVACDNEDKEPERPNRCKQDQRNLAKQGREFARMARPIVWL